MSMREPFQPNNIANANINWILIYLVTGENTSWESMYETCETICYQTGLKAVDFTLTIEFHIKTHFVSMKFHFGGSSNISYVPISIRELNSNSNASLHFSESSLLIASTYIVATPNLGLFGSITSEAWSYPYLCGATPAVGLSLRRKSGYYVNASGGTSSASEPPLLPLSLFSMSD